MTSITSDQLTHRQQRERAFYRRYAPLQGAMEVDFSPVITDRPRPWNSYYHAYDLIRAHRVKNSGQGKVLEIGCGVGIAAVRLAKLAFDVHALDICQENINLSQQRAAFYDVADRCHFQTGTAEDLPHEDASFDLVVGFDILHHVEIKQAWAQVLRVLKPGGMVVFREPVFQSVIDPLRQLKAIRKLLPCDVSMDPAHHITPDERKISPSDLRDMIGSLDRPRVARFDFLARLHRLVPDWRVRMQQCDHQLFRWVPGLSRLGDTVVLSGYRPG